MRKLVVIKHSKYEWERKTLGLSHEQLVAKYSKEHANLDAILRSHDKQQATIADFKSVFGNAVFMMMDEIASQIERFDLIIAFGGDNSFTKISHYTKDIPILGVNSDPERSVGCLTRWAINTLDDIYRLRDLIDTYAFDVEEWTRLKASIDGVSITPSTSEYFFGEKLRNMMSRHVMVYRGKEYEQKSSGIIISTGAGSTGWYSSICGTKGAWIPTMPVASFVVSEPYNEQALQPYQGELGDGDVLKLYSLNDDQGHASCDAWECFPFGRGSEANICIGDPLHVLIPRV